MSVARLTGRTIVPALLLWGTALAAAPRQSVSDERSLERLNLMVRAGRAFQDRRFAEAVQLYRSAWAMEPDDGQPLVLAGVAAFETHDAALARHDLERALRRRLSPEDRELARTYLTLVGEELRTRVPEAAAGPGTPTAEGAGEEAGAWTPMVTTSFGGGYDSNARQVPGRGIDTNLLASPSPVSRSLFAAAGAQLGMARPLGESLEVELRYGVEQRLHANRTLEDLDFLDQEAALELTGRLGRLVQLSLVTSGDLSFTGGMMSLRPFQRSVRVDPQNHARAGPAAPAARPGLAARQHARIPRSPISRDTVWRSPRRRRWRWAAGSPL